MLAIVIPYYKITFFKETIESLANQTDKRFKVYIGDDASQDDPTSLLKEYEGKFDYVYKRFENNVGGTSLVKQWQRCIEIIGVEEWLMILGDDDYMSNNLIESWYKYFEEFEHKAEVVRFKSQLVDEESSNIFEVYKNPTWEFAHESFMRKIRKQSRSSLSEYIFSKKTYNNNQFTEYPLAWHSDDKAWLDFSDNKPIFSIEESKVFVRISPLNITGKKDNLKLKCLADNLFLRDFINSNYLQSNKDINAVLLSFETILKRSRRLEISEWAYLFKIYLKYFELVSLVKFIRRFALALLK